MGKELNGFDEFWSVYPKRKGDNPRIPARTSFDKAIRRGAEALDIITGAKSYAAHKDTKIGTEFIPMAVTWLNQCRWDDWVSSRDATAATSTMVGSPEFFVVDGTPEMDAWDAYLRETTGKNAPRGARSGGWTFPTRWPPGHQEQAGMT